LPDGSRVASATATASLSLSASSSVKPQARPLALFVTCWCKIRAGGLNTRKVGTPCKSSVAHLLSSAICALVQDLALVLPCSPWSRRSTVLGTPSQPLFKPCPAMLLWTTRLSCPHLACSRVQSSSHIRAACMVGPLGRFLWSLVRLDLLQCALRPMPFATQNMVQASALKLSRPAVSGHLVSGIPLGPRGLQMMPLTIVACVGSGRQVAFLPCNFVALIPRVFLNLTS
jgi:hypothetical protein